MSSACSAPCGIPRERERQKQSARALARALLAGDASGARAWQPADLPFDPHEPDDIARACEAALPCVAHVVHGACAWVYLVASVAPDSWIGLREGTTAAPEAPQETCLRVGLSPWARFATLQETRWRGERDGDGWWVEEERLVGVVDRRLQMFVKATQGLLRKRRMVTLDAALLAETVRDDDASTLWTVLFDGDDMAARCGVWLPGVAMGVGRSGRRRRATERG